ncbi:MAG: MbtH domain protein [Rhizonema sp. PD37]|nr:MbtH domain protein [Rhizonema sp. PD37]
MNELVQRLSQGEHPVEASLRPEKTATAFKESIDRGYVHIKFTNTKGGTDLGVQLDTEASNFNEADFLNQKGQVHIVGNLTLNYEKVRCIADIDLATLEGKGHLEPIEG